MKKLLLIPLTILTTTAFAQVRVNLNNDWAVTFPVKPVISKPDTAITIYTSTLGDAHYIVTVKKLGKLPDIGFNYDSLDHFYDALVNRSVKNTNAKLGVKQTITINDKRAIQFDYSLVNAGADIPDTRVQQSVYLNKVLVSFAFWTFKNKLDANIANKEVFFNSIGKPTAVAPEAKYTAAAATVTKTDSSSAAATSVTQASGGASWFSKHLDTLLGFVVGLLLVLGVRFFINKKKK